MNDQLSGKFEKKSINIFFLCFYNFKQMYLKPSFKSPFCLYNILQTSKFMIHMLPCWRRFALKVLVRALKSAKWLNTLADRISWEVRNVNTIRRGEERRHPKTRNQRGKNQNHCSCHKFWMKYNRLKLINANKKKKKKKKNRRKVQGVPQSQTAALPRARGNRNAERTEKHKNKITQGITKIRYQTN